LNFDGASKGNLGPAGYGVVIRDNTGQIRHIMAGNLGFNSNNSVELWGLIRGIQLASSLNLNQLIIEGDSQVIISLATKIINGSDPAKVSPSWHLLGLLEVFHALLSPSLILIPSHIRREGE
jgi:ribonuclease HI